MKCLAHWVGQLDTRHCGMKCKTELTSLDMGNEYFSCSLVMMEFSVMSGTFKSANIHHLWHSRFKKN